MHRRSKIIRKLDWIVTRSQMALLNGISQHRGEIVYRVHLRLYENYYHNYKTKDRESGSSPLLSNRLEASIPLRKKILDHINIFYLILWLSFAWIYPGFRLKDDWLNNRYQIAVEFNQFTSRDGGSNTVMAPSRRLSRRRAALMSLLNLTLFAILLCL